MKKLLIISIALLLGISASAQELKSATVVADAKKPSQFWVSPAGDTLKVPSTRISDTIHVSSRGGYYVFCLSKKTGKTYKTYLQPSK